MRDTPNVMSQVGDNSQSIAEDLCRAVFDDMTGQLSHAGFALGPEVWHVVHCLLNNRRIDLL